MDDSSVCDEQERQPGPIWTDEDTFNHRAALDGLKLRVHSQAFRGGRVTAMLSGVTLDFRNATLAPEGATLNLRSALSGIDILVPKDWNVICDVNATYSGLDDARALSQPAAPGPRLRVTGRLVASGLFVR